LKNQKIKFQFSLS